MDKLQDSRQAGVIAEMEITPSMVEAGLCVLEQLRESHDGSSLVSVIYTAMQRAHSAAIPNKRPC